MCQEDAEKKISYDCLRTIVDDAIKTKDICTIERIEVTENQLRYMQKYAESLISKDESGISFDSYFIGMDSVALAILSLGLSYFLFVASILKLEGVAIIYIYTFFGIALAFGGAKLLLWEKPKQKKEFENKNKDIKFMHKIILKIEERLSNRK